MTRSRIRIAVVAALIAGSTISALGVAVAGDDPSTPAAASPDQPGTKVGTNVRTARDRLGTGAQEQFPEQVTSGNFTAITPYRAYDSRLDRKWSAREAFSVNMLTDYQLNPRIPSNATAVAFNITLTETASGFGFVTVFNGDATAVPETSTINWVLPDFSIANGGIVALGAPGPYLGDIGVAVDGAPGAATHILVDITGYYTP